MYSVVKLPTLCPSDPELTLTALLVEGNKQGVNHMKIIDQLRQLKYPINNTHVALRLGKSIDHAKNTMRLARDYGLITLEAYGMYWPTKKLMQRWKE